MSNALGCEYPKCKNPAVRSCRYCGDILCAFHIRREELCIYAPNQVHHSIASADEWPATERAVIEVSEVVYFRDFLRSLWRRLRRHRKV